MDGGYILGGSSNSSAGGDKTQANIGLYDYWIVKTDLMGNKQWDKSFGGTDWDELLYVQQTMDGGYILGGFSISGISGDKTQPTKGGNDYWIIKIDSLGNKQWDKDFGGSVHEELWKITQTKDGGYLISGDSYSQISGDKTENNLGIEQTWIIKTDSLGNKLWAKTLFTDSHDENGLAIVSREGCYIMANTTGGGIAGYKTQSAWNGSSDYWIIKFCDSTQTVALPVSNFISSDTLFCDEAGKCISFSDNSTNNPTNWQWLFPGASPNTSSQQNPTNICYTQPGTYAVTLIVSNAAGSDTLTVSPMITVGTAPVAPILTVSYDTIFCSTAAYYQWYRDGNLISGATDSFYVFTQNGTYAVQITDGIGCSRLSDGVVITGVQSSEFKVQSIRVFPNPAGDVLRVEGMGREATVSVFNTLGEVMQAAIYNDKAALNIKSLSAGIYFIRVINEKGNWVGRLVKE